MKFVSRMPHLPAVAVLGTTVLLAQSGHAQSSSVKLPGDVSMSGASSRGSAFPYVPYFPVTEAPTIPGVSLPTTPPTAPTAPAPSAEALRARSQQLRQRLQGLVQTSSVEGTNIFLGTPGIGGNTPTAYAASKGVGGVGVTYQNQTLFTNNSDAQAQLILGFGDPRKSVGLRVSGNLLDLDNPGKRGSFSFLAHRQFSGDFAVGVGIENTLKWGNRHDTPASTFGVVTKMFRLKPNGQDAFSRAHLSLGVGNGRFKRDADFASIGARPARGSVGVFGSASIKIARPINLFTEWDGNDINVGASIAPFRRYPLIIVPTFAGLTDHTNTGKRFNLGVGYGFTY